MINVALYVSDLEFDDVMQVRGDINRNKINSYVFCALQCFVSSTIS